MKIERDRSNTLIDIKVINYNDKYKNEVCNFINESMHNFIGRPYKERPDVSNINEYYMQNGGNFWIAMDNNKNKIVGTIAIENRKNTGVLKRFYVDNDYQHIGIGTKLYNTLEKYVKENTNISKLYLACGQVLEKAHKFYIKNGWIQTPELEIDMHVANDDDFFKKELQ